MAPAIALDTARKLFHPLDLLILSYVIGGTFLHISRMVVLTYLQCAACYLHKIELFALYFTKSPDFSTTLFPNWRELEGRTNTVKTSIILALPYPNHRPSSNPRDNT